MCFEPAKASGLLLSMELLKEQFSVLFLPLPGQQKADVRNRWSWRWRRQGYCWCDGDGLPGWGRCYFNHPGECGCGRLNLNLSVQDMGWYSLAVEVDPYFFGQGHSDGGHKAETSSVNIILSAKQGSFLVANCHIGELGL